MEAIILAGGLGTRLRSVVTGLPKPMAPVHGRPFLEILIEQLSFRGFDHIILSVGYLKESIINHFKTHPINVCIEFSPETSALGTGGAVRRAMSLCRNEAVFVLNGDTFQDFDPAAMRRKWDIHRSPVMLLRNSFKQDRYGGVSVDEYKVIDFSTASASQYEFFNSGIYLLPRDLFNRFDLPSSFSLESFFEREINILNFRFHLGEGHDFFDIGTPEDYIEFCRFYYKLMK